MIEALPLLFFPTHQIDDGENDVERVVVLPLDRKGLNQPRQRELRPPAALRV